MRKSDYEKLKPGDILYFNPMSSEVGQKVAVYSKCEKLGYVIVIPAKGEPIPSSEFLIEQFFSYRVFNLEPMSEADIEKYKNRKRQRLDPLDGAKIIKPTSGRYDFKTGTVYSATYTGALDKSAIILPVKGKRITVTFTIEE